MARPASPLHPAGRWDARNVALLALLLGLIAIAMLELPIPPLAEDNRWLAVTLGLIGA